MKETIPSTEAEETLREMSTVARCANMMSIAEEMCAYRQGFKKGGFTKDEAFKMVLEYQQMFWMKEFYPDGPGIGFEVDGI